MEIVAVRSAPVLGVASMSSVAAPDPLSGVTRAHPWLLDARHAHPLGAERLTLLRPPV
jgi:hypothetical protein